MGATGRKKGKGKTKKKLEGTSAIGVEKFKFLWAKDMM